MVIGSYLFFLLTTGLVFPDPAPRFKAQTIDENLAIGYGLALGDVDGDGKTDILLADKKQFVWYRNGDWKRFVLAENLTQHDNVCIAAQDLNGDGKVEVAVGAQWNPGETTDEEQSGAVFYLVRPQDPTQSWEAVRLPHEPTVHRMRWVKTPGGAAYLVVVPLHGRGNKNGEGAGVKIMAYQFPQNPRTTWPTQIVDETMHLTHNLAVVENKVPKPADLYIAGKEGVRQVKEFRAQPAASPATKIPGVETGAGEIRVGNPGTKQSFLATIEPMHGTAAVVYLPGTLATRVVLDENLKEGHALATADLLGLGRDQVVAGWRNPNAENKTGIKLYVPTNKSNTEWQAHWIDENGMATEDLQVGDLNNDSKPDIIAAGRATKNLKIYWNESK
jgi:hypothetical protein